jgi:fumarate reductase subunit C
MSDMQSDARKPYVRPMGGWWRKNPFFVRYMARELTALVVAAYAFVLLAGMLCLANGETAYNVWLTALRHPVSVALHAVALAAMAYHTWSWFEIMPKTMPPVVVGGKRVAAATITGAGIVAALVVTAVVFLAVWSIPS